MVAEFYIVAESFANNTNFTTPEIESKTKSLASDFVYIKKYSDTNKLFVHPNIYTVNFLNGISLSDLLHNPKIAKEHLDRDVFGALQNIIDKSLTTTHTSQEVIEVLLPEHNENLCHGLIAFNPVANVKPELQIVYHLQGWFDFRRYYLGLHPKNENFYIDECVKYFPQLYFHPRVRTTINSILKSSSNKITHHLGELNDKFNSSQTNPYSRVETLKRFNSVCEFDQKAAPEGDLKRKRDLSWEFTNNTGVPEFVYCELHLRLLKDDYGKVSTDRRIYFHEGIPNIQGGKILIGHIGDHL